MADDVSWSYGSRGITLRGVAPGVVEVRAAPCWWRLRFREVRRELVVTAERDYLLGSPLAVFWVDSGVQLALAPRWVWASLQHAVELERAGRSA